MMQSKKDEVKKDIEAAALQTFFEKGFVETKMSDIADAIGISVGNIYTYFKNKKDLFYSVVPPILVDYLKKILVETIHFDNQHFPVDADSEARSSLFQAQIDLLATYNRQIIIIFEKNKGTSYVNAKNELVDLMVETKKAYLTPPSKHHELNPDEHMAMLHIIAHHIIDMNLDLLKREMSADSRRRIFQTLSVYQLNGMKSLYDS
ncbi:TetR family transcriptional regulator [Saccharibacillus sp. O16]|nr:TetR family transcriptional regulator [Saccharibacillus sp. O16]